MDPVNTSADRSEQRPRYVTVRDGKAGLPYSKGLMATSIMAAGLPPYRAFQVAEVVEQWLHAERREVVTTAELRDMAVRVLEEEIGPRYAENYRRWQQAGDRQRPLIVLIGGSTGVGKSTVATTVAGRLGIVRIVSTDAVREVMRGIFTREIMPSLHTSSFDVNRLLPDPPGDVDPVIAGFRQQVLAVSVGVNQIIRRAVVEGTDLIVEGAHAVPGILDLPQRDDAVVAQMVVTVDEEPLHRSHFVARSQDARARGHERYLRHFGDIRKIQDYIRTLAIEHGVPVVPSWSLDTTVSRVMELVVTSTTEVAAPSPAGSPPRLGDEPPSHDVAPVDVAPVDEALTAPRDVASATVPTER